METVRFSLSVVPVAVAAAIFVIIVLPIVAAVVDSILAGAL